MFLLFHKVELTSFKNSCLLFLGNNYMSKRKTCTDGVFKKKKNVLMGFSNCLIGDTATAPIDF